MADGAKVAKTWKKTHTVTHQAQVQANPDDAEHIFPALSQLLGSTPTTQH